MPICACSTTTATATATATATVRFWPTGYLTSKTDFEPKGDWVTPNIKPDPNPATLVEIQDAALSRDWDDYVSSLWNVHTCMANACSNRQMLTCSSVKCSNAKCSNAQMPNAQTTKCQVLKPPNAKCLAIGRIDAVPHAQMTKCSNAQIPNALQLIELIPFDTFFVVVVFAWCVLKFTHYGGGINGTCSIYDPPFSFWCQSTFSEGCGGCFTW